MVRKTKAVGSISRSGEQINETLIIPKNELIHTTRPMFDLIDSEFQILLTPDPKANPVFSWSKGAVLGTAIGAIVSILVWLDKVPHPPDWWAEVKAPVWTFVGSALVWAASWLTLRTAHDPRSKLIQRIREFFDANG